MEFLEFEDPNVYRKKIKGFSLAFHIKGKNYRIPDDDPAHKYKVRYKKIPFSDVKKMVQEIRDKRENEK